MQQDPTGFPVRRWLAPKANAGGFISESFVLSDQPNFGNWSLEVAAFVSLVKGSLFTFWVGKSANSFVPLLKRAPV